MRSSFDLALKACGGPSQFCDGQCGCKSADCPVEPDCDKPTGLVCYPGDGGAPRPASCSDGQQNGCETGVDCGGGQCPPCMADEGCRVKFAATDCISGLCELNSRTCACSVSRGGCPPGKTCNADTYLCE
jgi:hypothetical protein